MSTSAPSTTGLEDALQAALKEGGLITEDRSHVVDGVKPQFTATPSSSAELAAVLACANEHGAAVIPWGAGTSMALGNVPERYDVALSTTRLDRVLEYEPADLTVTVEAGLTLAKLKALLGEHGQL
ncbi:MAG: FAD-binding protein, partial [Chloroflexi bacterium]|nr:FAD-binding protein [Chloroflexota bacterium]